MKLPLIILFLFYAETPVFEERADIKKIRQLYKRSVTDGKACREMFALLSPVDAKRPLLLGYKASSSMMMAKYAGNPFSKLSYFKKGKQMLERAIQLDRTNVELRFLRFMTQANAPSFLGYNADVETDKGFILNNISSLKEAGSREFITTALKKSKYLSAEEKGRMN